MGAHAHQSLPAGSAQEAGAPASNGGATPKSGVPQKKVMTSIGKFGGYYIVRNDWGNGCFPALRHESECIVPLIGKVLIEVIADHEKILVHTLQHSSANDRLQKRS